MIYFQAYHYFLDKKFESIEHDVHPAAIGVVGGTLIKNQKNVWILIHFVACIHTV